MIRSRVAELYGDSSGSGSVTRCPGENGCSRWQNATGDFEQKKTATLGCDRCNGNPPLESQTNSPEAVKDRIIAHVEGIVRQQNAGTLDLNILDYLDWRLLEIYRDEETQRERVFKAETHIIFKELLKSRGGN